MIYQIYLKYLKKFIFGFYEDGQDAGDHSDCGLHDDGQNVGDHVEYVQELASALGEIVWNLQE